jgi:hypothetical protein
LAEEYARTISFFDSNTPVLGDVTNRSDEGIQTRITFRVAMKRPEDGFQEAIEDSE